MKELKLYNSLSRTKEVFQPLEPGQIQIYVCGPTVYDFLHVGNFRGPVFFNLVRNWFEHLGYRVFYAVNFTDVDDKIIDRALKMNEPSVALAARFIEEYRTDFKSLKLRPADLNPRVTETMPEIIKFIEDLIQKEKAYEVQGDVQFSISTFSEYGKLSGRKTEDLLQGEGNALEDHKRNPQDFALWKKAKPGEPSWDSPWGPGRPGWHIECSAMIKKHFGEQIDIHGGGLDLLFPHHENEVAQSESLTGKKFANYWVHWNLLNLTGAKMSKSLGNIITLREFLEINHPEIYKWMILSVHYRSVFDFGDEAVGRAIQGLGRIYSALALAEEYLPQQEGELPSSAGAGAETKGSAPGWNTRVQGFQKICDEQWSEVEKSLNDDFNTPEAFAALFELTRAFNGQIKRGSAPHPELTAKARSFQDFVLKFGAIISLFQEPAKEFLREIDNRLLSQLKLDRDEIQRLVDQRTEARKAKNFSSSDELRAQLTRLGISVSDTPQGSFWEVTK